MEVHVEGRTKSFGSQLIWGDDVGLVIDMRVKIPSWLTANFQVVG